MRWIKERLGNRPDSEHGQALVRLTIASLILIYLWLLHAYRDESHTDAVSLVMMAETLVALLIMAAIIWKPGTSHPRRIFGMLTDYATLGVLMSLDPEPLAPLYVIMLWVAVGNGMRYGMRYLFLSAFTATATFSLVVWINPYWYGQPYIAVGLIVGLLAIPAYLSSLLRDLHRRTEEARLASEAKSRFLANMSHEFRSPLNGIIGMAELMDTKRLSPEERECAQVIHASAQTLLMLVEDVLDISAIESGKLPRKDRPFLLGEMLTRIETMLDSAASTKGLDLDVEVDPDVPDGLFGDSGHLSQVLMNLMHNAVKFTDVGAVRLSVSRLETREDGLWLRFSVRDTGIGIPDDHKKRIFEAFEQVDSGVTRRFDGTGLGTTIARTLTQRLGGRIGLEDNPGGGSHFWIEIPMGLSDEALPGDGPMHRGNVVDFDDSFVRHRARVGSLNVLIADDQAANRVVLTRILERAGHSVVSAECGETALDLLAGGGIDLAVIDLHMPGLSGAAVLRQLRVMEAQGPRTPVIVLSADATPEAARMVKEEGALAYLTKPIRVPRLLEAIALATGVPQRSPAVAARTESASPPRSVLAELADEGLGGPFLIGFVDQCLGDADTCMEALAGCARLRDWVGFREAAHALKGAAANLGATAVGERCQQCMQSDDPVLEREALLQITQLRELLAQAAQTVRKEVRVLVDQGSRTSATER